MSTPAETSVNSRQEDESASSSFASLLDCRKRTYENAVGSKSESVSAKLKKPLYYFKLESESDQPTDEDSESVHSVQGKETDFAKDTSDTSSHRDWSDSPESIQIEYELATSSDKSSLHSDSFSSGTDEDHIRIATVLAAVIDDDLGLFADSSNSGSEPVFDPDLRKDYWTCVQCKCKNNNPLFRYCEKCFRLRKGFLPPRPRHHRSKKRPKILHLPTDEDGSKEGDNQLTKSSSELTTDSGYQCSEPVSSQTSTSQGTSEINDGLGLCITCMSRPKNGIFVHSKISHCCCCYKCALKVWKGQGRCPICQMKIKNVLQFTVC